MNTPTRPSPPSTKRVSLLEIATTFAAISSTSFGGGQKASVRHQVVGRGWMTDEEFIEALELAELMPGPNVLNLAIYCAQRVRGTLGGVVAALASTIPPFAIVLLAGLLYFRFIHNPFVRAALAGCAAGAVGLTLGNAIELSLVYRNDVVRVALIVVTAVAVGRFKVPLALALAVFGGIGIWRQHASPQRSA